MSRFTSKIIAILIPFLVCCCRKIKEDEISEAWFKRRAISQIQKQYPGAPNDLNHWKIILRENTYTVSPKLPPGAFGGGATADLDSVTGEVLRVYFTE